MQFYDINKITRKKLYNYLKSFKDDENNFYDEFLERILELENENENYYRYLIGLMYIDNYRLLSDIEVKTKEEKLKLMFYDGISDIDDLIFMIKEEIEILSDIIDAPIEISTQSLIDQAFTLNEMDNEKIKKFSPATLMEKMNFFKSYTLEEINDIYNENLNIKNITNIFILLAIGNFNCFKSLILKIVLIDYKWLKLLEKENKITDDFLHEFIFIVENVSLDELVETLSNDYELIEIIVKIYFEYIKKHAYDQAKIDENYDKNVKEKIKLKLKEVSL